MSNTQTNENHRQTVGHWLSRPFEWRIPVYQRHYAWEPEEEFGPTQLFWEIVEERAKKKLNQNDVPPHYFGAILVEDKTPVFDKYGRYDVVDGQQRLTTINIAMFAIIGVASRLGRDYCRQVQDDLAKYIFNDTASGNRTMPKLLPTNFDRTQFSNLRSHAYDSDPNYRDDSEQAKRSRVVHACNFFSEKFKTFVDNNSPSGDKMVAIQALIDVILNGFELVLIQLKKTDEAQKVFESLNNTAKRLSTFDLIRNDVFYRADKESTGLDEELFNSSTWQQFEDVFWEKPSSKRADSATHIEAYTARMLMAKKRQFFLLDRNSIYGQYKAFAEDQKSIGLGVRAEISTISEYVDVYKYLVGATRINPLGADFDFGYLMYKDSKSLDFYPVIFVIAMSQIPVEEKQRMISLLESYVIRRHIAKLTSGNYNKQAPVICKVLGSKPSYETLGKFLKEDPDSDTRKFPTDDEIINSCRNGDFYSLKINKYIFECIVWGTTTEERDEKRDLAGLTIDHIMPQEWREKDGWQKMASKFKENEVVQKINTIGNLTPMSKGLNSQKSNHDWLGPKGAQAWLKKCDLKMTRELADKPKWDLNDIDERSEKLARVICEIWPMDF